MTPRRFDAVEQMPDASHQHHHRSILKNGQMPLLKRINTASGVSLCQEKMRGGKQ
jgi:hypothetical protein